MLSTSSEIGLAYSFSSPIQNVSELLRFAVCISTAGLKKTVAEVKKSVDLIERIIKPAKDVVGVLADYQELITTELTRAQNVSS